MSAEIFETVRNIIAEIEAENPTSAEEVERFLLAYLGSKNSIKPLFAEMRNVDNAQKKELGLLLISANSLAERKY